MPFLIPIRIDSNKIINGGNKIISLFKPKFKNLAKSQNLQFY